MISLHLENTIIELEIPCNKTLKNKKKSFIIWFQLYLVSVIFGFSIFQSQSVIQMGSLTRYSYEILNKKIIEKKNYFEMVEVWYWCSMVLLHSFEQFQYDYKLKKIFWKSWHHRATVAGKSLRQKIAITINFFIG